MEKQDLGKLQVRKMKGLKRKNTPVAEDDANSEVKMLKNDNDNE